MVLFSGAVGGSGSKEDRHLLLNGRRQLLLVLLSFLQPRRYPGRLLLAAGLAFAVYLWLTQEGQSAPEAVPKSATPAPVFSDFDRAAGDLGRLDQPPPAAATCRHPPFVLRPDRLRAAARFRALHDAEQREDDEEGDVDQENEEELEEDEEAPPRDPSYRARVGPTPQGHPEANYTVIYNFASPLPPGQPENEEGESGELFALVTHVSPERLLSDLPPLLERWPRPHPVSVAVYAPGEDFCLASALVSWLWHCSDRDGRLSLAARVSFHVLFRGSDAADVALKNAATESGGVGLPEVDCEVQPEASFASFRAEKGLPYPANAARNAAAAATSASGARFFLSLDADFLPSPGLADNFLALAKDPEFQEEFFGAGAEGDESRKAKKLKKKRRTVFAVPAFDLRGSGSDPVPSSKAELVSLYSRGKASYLDKNKPSCGQCQQFPGLGGWLKASAATEEPDKAAAEKASPDSSLGVFKVSRRHPPFHRWEPFFVGTLAEPPYDERLLSEDGGGGRSDRSALLHELCLSGYRVAVLDTAFLIRRQVNKSGVKVRKDDGSASAASGNNNKVFKKLRRELVLKYHEKTKCRPNF